MTARRSHIGLKTKLASALCQMLRPNECGELVPVIPHEQARAMTEDQILSTFHFDHWPFLKAQDGPDVHWNLVPRPVEEHLKKTRTQDVPQIAKTKRLSKATDRHRQAMAEKAGGEPQMVVSRLKPKQKIPGRPFPRGRKFSSRKSA